LNLFVSVLNSEQPGHLNPVQKDLIGSMHGIIQRLERLTGYLSVILNEGNGFPVQQTPIDVATIAEACYREASITASVTGVGITFDIKRDSGDRFYGDPIRFTQVVINLLDNAVRYATPGTTIDFKVRQSPTRVLVVVENQVDGPVSDSLSDWFVPYARGSSARERSPRGFGLGLTVVSELARTLQGRVLTRGRGQTATIGVVLPREQRGEVTC
jgi:signal transduction histidine kinase